MKIMDKIREFVWDKRAQGNLTEIGLAIGILVVIGMVINFSCRTKVDKVKFNDNMLGVNI